MLFILATHNRHNVLKLNRNEYIKRFLKVEHEFYCFDIIVYFYDK